MRLTVWGISSQSNGLASKSHGESDNLEIAKSVLKMAEFVTWIQSHEIEVYKGNGMAVNSELKMAASIESETELQGLSHLLQRKDSTGGKEYLEARNIPLLFHLTHILEISRSPIFFSKSLDLPVLRVGRSGGSDT